MNGENDDIPDLGYRTLALTFKSTHSKQHHHSWQTKHRGAFEAQLTLRSQRLYHREARPLALLGQHVQIQSDTPPRNSRYLPQSKKGCERTG